MGDDNDDFFKALDRAGPYPLSEENPGQLTQEALVKLLSVMQYRIQRMFAIKKTKLQKKRINLLLKKND